MSQRWAGVAAVPEEGWEWVLRFICSDLVHVRPILLTALVSSEPVISHKISDFAPQPAHGNPADISSCHPRQKLPCPDIRPPKQSNKSHVSQLARRLFCNFQSPGWWRFNQVCRMSSIQWELKVWMVEEETEGWTWPGKQNPRVDQIYILGHCREMHFMGIW